MLDASNSDFFLVFGGRQVAEDTASPNNVFSMSSLERSSSVGLQYNELYSSSVSSSKVGIR